MIEFETNEEAEFWKQLYLEYTRCSSTFQQSAPNWCDNATLYFRERMKKLKTKDKQAYR